MLSPLQKKVMGFRHSSDKLSKEGKRKKGEPRDSGQLGWEVRPHLCEGETLKNRKETRMSSLRKATPGQGTRGERPSGRNKLSPGRECQPYW